MVQERKDRLMAYRVDVGLRVQREVSTRAAAAYMSTYGVPFDVSMRVLSTPNKRAPTEHVPGTLWFEIVRAAGVTYGG